MNRRNLFTLLPASYLVGLLPPLEVQTGIWCDVVDIEADEYLFPGVCTGRAPTQPELDRFVASASERLQARLPMERFVRWERHPRIVPRRAGAYTTYAVVATAVIAAEPKP